MNPRTALLLCLTWTLISPIEHATARQAEPLIDPNHGGQAGSLQLVELSWGRLVDVYAQGDPSAPAQFAYQDFLVGDQLVSEPGKWRFETSLASGREQMILEADHIVGVAGRFERLLSEAASQLEVVQPMGWLDPPPFSRVARNAALSARFDDLIDPATVVAGESVRVSLDAAGSKTFAARVLPDFNHGGISAGDGSFYPTRVLIDLTVTASESSSAPLPLQATGLPAGTSLAQASFDVALPTRANAAAGLFTVLRNLAGASLSKDFNGPTKLGPAGVLEVVRAANTAGADDPFAGYLQDHTPPFVVAEHEVLLLDPQVPAGGQPGFDFLVDVQRTAPVCSVLIAVDDGIALASGEFLRVVAAGTPAAGGAQVDDVVLRLEGPGPLVLGPSTSALAIGDARLLVPGPQAACAIGTSLPVAGPGSVHPSTSLLIRFSEAMDVGSARPFDNLFVTGVEQDPGAYDFVPGAVLGDDVADELRFVPAQPFAHQGNGEDYFLHVGFLNGVAPAGAQTDLTDLAGNPLAELGGAILFTIDASAAPVLGGALTLRFDGLDSDGTAGADLRGQFQLDTRQGVLLGRPVSRFSSVVDSAAPTFAQMQLLATGVQTPLSNLGSKLQFLWRYPELGMSATQKDDTFNNLDVEGIAIAPRSGLVVQSFYPLFEIQLGHASRLPDEDLDPNLLPFYVDSGFVPSTPYAQNYLTDAELVHPREKGFFLSAAQVFTSATGTAMLPLPLNQGLAVGETPKTYTWRDTALVERGALSPQLMTTLGTGVPLPKEVELGLVNGPGSEFGKRGASAKQGIPSVGLPLLMQTSCYPSEGLSLNQFTAALGLTSSSQPSFRAFSTGGFNTQGTPVIKDPDLEIFPSGGFNGDPSLAPIGSPTLPTDPVVLSGQVDFVVRVSRAHTAYLRALGFADPDWKGALVDVFGELPAGTQIELAFRGNDAPPNGAQPLADAAAMDVYGDLAEGDLSDDLADYFGFEVSHPQWTSNLDELDGVQSVQVRISLIGNVQSFEIPRLDTLVLMYD